MVKFVNHINLTLSYWSGEGELTEAEGGGSASLIELRGMGGEWVRPVRVEVALGEGNGQGQLAPVRCIATALMAHSAGDETAQGRVLCEGASTVNWGQSGA
jgi:hypothetical protein